jgi:hypothetical protein
MTGKLIELFSFDKHVIRDCRNGKLYYREEHDCHEAFVRFMMEDGERMCSDSENLLVRKDFAIFQHVLLLAQAAGRFPAERISSMRMDDDEAEPEKFDCDSLVRKFGHFEIVYGCTHSKNQLHADLVLSDLVLSEPEKYPEETRQLAQNLQEGALRKIHFGFKEM